MTVTVQPPHQCVIPGAGLCGRAHRRGAGQDPPLGRNTRVETSSSPSLPSSLFILLVVQFLYSVVGSATCTPPPHAGLGGILTLLMNLGERFDPPSCAVVS